MTIDFTTTVALVTGGNRGVGRAFVDELLTRGATVYMGTRILADITEHPRLHQVQVDVSNSDDVAELAAQVPGLTMLVNNAGIHKTTTVLESDAAEITAEVLGVNTIGMIAITAAVQHLLVRSGQGVIINVLSAGSWLSGGSNLAYAASKAASLSVTNNTRATLNPLGVQVVAVHAGFIDTDMMTHFAGPKMAPTLVAQLTLDGTAEGLQEILTDDLARGAKAHAIDHIAPYARPAV